MSPVRLNWKTRLAVSVRSLSVYAALLLLPGGSLAALSLFALRHGGWFRTQARRTLATVSARIPHHAPTR
jgi:hypothetical protein